MASIKRKWRVLAWLGGSLAGLVGVYALVGFVLVPYLAQERLWPWLSAELGGQFQAERVAFNPFRGSASVGGFSLKGADGAVLAAIGEATLDVDVAATIKNRSLIARARIIRPQVNIQIDRQGRPNFAFLAPKEHKDTPAPEAFPFLLAGLDIQQGRLVFERQGFKKLLSPLDFTLANLGPGTTAHFRLHAQGEGKEVLSAEGDVRLEKSTLDGAIRWQGLELVPLAAWLAPAQAYSVRGGSLALALDCHYAPQTGWEIPAAEAEIQALSLAQSGQPFLDAGSVKAQGLSLQTKTKRLGLKSFHASALRLAQDARPLLNVDGIAAQDFSFQLNKGAMALERLTLDGIELKAPSPVVDKDGKPRQFLVDSVAVGGATVDTVKKSLAIAMIQTNHSMLAAWLGQDGSPGFAGLPETDRESTTDKGDAKDGKKDTPWRVRLERVELNDNNIALRDFRSDPPGRMRLANMNLLVKAFDSAADQPFWLGMNTGLGFNGRIALEGQVKLAPLAVSLKMYVDDLSLPPFQAYLDQAVRIRVVKGLLNMNADIDYDEATGHRLRLGGDVAVADFASIDKQEERDFVNWKGLRLNGLIYEDAPQRLSIREAILTEPYARAFIDADKKFNIAENLSPPQTHVEKPAKPEGEGVAKATQSDGQSKQSDPSAVVIGVLHIHGGSADFADMTIQPTSFAINIHDLNGDIRSLSSRQDAKSDVLLHGKLNHDSTVRIFGKINPLSLRAFTDLTMDFNDVNLTTLSPYAAKFAGYRVEKGKLSMNLRYQLENQQLTAENKFVFDQLVLGERVDSPDATSLPVRLAVSLLKDADGKIDVSLPISGDLRDPDVSIRGLLAGAATSLIRKLAASPFTLLSGLVGGSPEDMEAVRFPPGAATLTRQEKDKLAGLAKALQDRPELNLDIKGTAHEAIDRTALAEEDLARQLKNARLIELGRKKGKNAEWDGTTLTQEDYSRLLTNLYRWKNPSAQELQGSKSGTALSGTLLENAKRKLLETWPVGEMDLRGLAQARGEAVRNFLVKERGLPDQRIYLLEVNLNERGQQEAKALLSVSEP